MSVQRLVVVLLAVLGVGVVAPAAGGAASVPPGVLQQFQAEVSGVATINWVTQRGSVGESCQDWRYEEGKVTQTFSPKKAVLFTLASGRIVGVGPGRVSLKGRLEKTFAFLTEPGCPAVCPDATFAQAGPMARAADCAQTATRRKESLISCDSGSVVSSLYEFTGASSLGVRPVVLGSVQPGAEECQSKGRGLPAVKGLLSARKLRTLSARGRLKATRTINGECPGTRMAPIPGFAQTKCTYRLRLTVKVSRLGR